jgi:predicted anti-sigma-YlaC factor YlaD
MISCKVASQLMSKAMDEKLSWRETIALKAHLAVCDLCRKFQKHLVVLRAGVKQILRPSSNDAGNKALPPDDRAAIEKLPDEAKNRIKQLIS